MGGTIPGGTPLTAPPSRAPDPLDVLLIGCRHCTVLFAAGHH